MQSPALWLDASPSSAAGPGDAPPQLLTSPRGVKRPWLGFSDARAAAPKNAELIRNLCAARRTGRVVARASGQPRSSLSGGRAGRPHACVRSLPGLRARCRRKVYYEYEVAAVRADVAVRRHRGSLRRHEAAKILRVPKPATVVHGNCAEHQRDPPNAVGGRRALRGHRRRRVRHARRARHPPTRSRRSFTAT